MTRKEVKFEAYIAKRLRGMVIDLVRKQDWIPRRVRQKATRLKRAAEELSIELGHTPSDQEMADYLKLSQKDYEELLSETAFSNLMSFEVLLDTYGNVTGKALSGNPQEDAYQQKELHEVLRRGIASLRENERLVLSLYYEKELTMKEIAQVLGSARRVFHKSITGPFSGSRLHEAVHRSVSTQQKGEGHMTKGFYSLTSGILSRAAGWTRLPTT